MTIVRYFSHEIPPLTEEEKAELEALSSRPDSEIDTRDIPSLTSEQLARMIPFEEAMRQRRAHKKQVVAV
jgi:hypothetical protein